MNEHDEMFLTSYLTDLLPFPVEQHRTDAATWRRILADPTLPTTLVRIEDAILFGPEDAAAAP